MLLEVIEIAKLLLLCLRLGRRSQVVRRESAKLLYTGSIPVVASTSVVRLSLLVYR